MKKYNKLVLLGAYGYTAQIIASSLSEAKIPFSVAGRNLGKLNELKAMYPSVVSSCYVDSESIDDISKLLTEFNIVINCIGPFNVMGPFILEQCVEKGICYIDICGEQNYVRNSFETFHEKAVKTGASIFHSIAFESALVDLLAKIHLPGNSKWKEISSVYYFEKSRPSPGTRLSMQTTSVFPVYKIENYKLHESGISSFSKMVEFPDRPELNAVLFAPYPEIIFFSKQFLPKYSCSYILTNQSMAKYAVMSNKENQKLEQILDLSKKRIKKGPDKSERENQYFEIILFAENSEGRKYCFSLTGKDMYGLTASIVTLYVEKIMNSVSLPSGVLCPSDIGDNDEVFQKILDQNKIELNTNCSFSFLKQDLG